MKRISALLVALVIMALLVGGSMPASTSAAIGDSNFTNVVASGTVTGLGIVLTKGTSITVTAGMAIAPNATYQPITASGAITNATLSTTGAVTGQVLKLVNVGSQSITILESTTAKTPSVSVALSAQYYTADFIFDGTYWVETATSANN